MDLIVQSAAARVPHDLDHQLAVDPLATVLRRATWGAHEEVESGPLETALVEGRLHPTVYADLLAQSLPVYRAIEDAAPAMSSDPVAAPFVRPEVARSEHVEKDLTHYLGPDWRGQVELLDVSRWYADRVRAVATEDPIGWIAHGYTRYLADLSGGLVIDEAITAAYDLDQDGRWLYTFHLPEGVDPTAWKNAYRQLLNLLDVSTADKRRLVEEALVAYQCNIMLNDELVARHGDIELAPAVR